eukprot:TRINITY_DN5607_c0_g1_i1.p1 TRINITY_DN5607_c0_g1~~TRINITY_DN5607_c0_g1_i1.p1  ORF type:complete len:68 (+),score=9.72 TRINITY_DN5607_c0_g1_i1:95-298(+)
MDFYCFIWNSNCVKNRAGFKKRIVLAELKSGDYFGELALLKNQARGATVTAKELLSVYYLGVESNSK